MEFLIQIKKYLDIQSNLHKLGQEMANFWLKVLMTKFRLWNHAAISAAYTTEQQLP